MVKADPVDSPALFTRESPRLIIKLMETEKEVGLVGLGMVHVPFLPAFHVPPKDLQRVPFRDGIEPGLPALADGISVIRSRSDKTPIAPLDLLTLNINNFLSSKYLLRKEPSEAQTLRRVDDTNVLENPTKLVNTLLL
jgi:hypothetical protein